MDCSLNYGKLNESIVKYFRMCVPSATYRVHFFNIDPQYGILERYHIGDLLEAHSYLECFIL